MDGFTLVDVPVAMGDLRVARRGHGAKCVLALHGLAGSHVSMTSLGARFDEATYTVLALDLRGRGVSSSLPGPYGIDAHLEDCVAVLAHFGFECAALVGHSMGGFIAARFAARYPEQAESITLIDGGLPLAIEIPAGQTAEDVETVMLASLVENLERTFPSVDAYLAQWRAHPALGGEWSADIERRFTYDVVSGPNGEAHSRVCIAAIRTDWSELITRDDLASGALETATCPINLFRSPRGLLNQPAPTLRDALVEEWSARVPRMRVETVEETNHLTVALFDHATERIAHVMQQDTDRELV